MTSSFAPAGMKPDDAREVVGILQARLDSLVDLGLTLKHVHWNVIGPGFIGVHEMIDSQVDGVRLAADAVAERIATLGGIPNGLAGGMVERRGWDDYGLGRAVVQAHLGAMDLVYDGVVREHREAIDATEDLDVVTSDLLTSQAATLEQYQWFVRAHLENTSGELSTAGATSEVDAAAEAATSDPLQ